MSKREVAIVIHPGEPEFGVWCDECLLPSAIRVPMTLHYRDGRKCGDGPPFVICSHQLKSTP